MRVPKERSYCERCSNQVFGSRKPDAVGSDQRWSSVIAHPRQPGAIFCPWVAAVHIARGLHVLAMYISAEVLRRVQEIGPICGTYGDTFKAIGRQR